MNMEISLVPTAGLCNRMNTILNAIALHDAYNNYNIKIFWEKNKDCYADFHDLFIPFDINGITLQPLKHIYLKPGCKKNLYIPALLRKTYFDASYNGNKILNEEFSIFTRNNTHIYIVANNRFCPFKTTKEPINIYFKPIREIEEKIKLIIEKYPINTIGIHIRQTDNVEAIKNNPIEKFIRLMDVEIEKDGNCKFYLATDSIEIKKFIIGKYKNKIIYNDFEVNRYSLIGMQNAVIELYCLGMTNKIIGCTNSTYSLIASRLYNIPLIL